MFFLLMTAYALCAQSPLALAAEGEPMVSLHGGVPQGEAPVGLVVPAPAGTVLHLRIFLGIRNKAEAEKMSKDLHDVSSPMYHKWLGKQKWNELFAPLPSDYEAIASWLKSQGFTVNAIRHDRYDVEFTGTVAQADEAFRVQIMSMRDGKHYGILPDPMIPTRFQSVISDVIGFDNLGDVGPAAKLGGQIGFAPADFYNFYDEAALLNAGTRA